MTGIYIKLTFLETFQRKDMKITTKGIGENLIGLERGC